MKNFQKLGSLLLAALMILSLAACGNKTNNTPAQTPSESTPTQTPDDAANGEADNTTSSGKVLVVYFSASGNTKRVAEDIAEAADGDLFEITPAEPYTSCSLIHISEPTRLLSISYAVFCLKKKILNTRLLSTSPSPRCGLLSRMSSSA